MKDLLALAQAAWPELSVPGDVFRAYAAQRDADAARAGELYLACACAHGDPRAIAALEARYFGDIDRALGRRQLAPAAIAEVKQILREKLFVGSAPKIAEYDGRGDLGAWLRTTAIRQALKLLRSERRERPASDERILDGPALEDDPELALVKGTSHAAFKNAFQKALGALEPRQQNLLRQHFLDGLTLDELAKLHSVHRATCARWLAQARQAVLEGTRAALSAEIGVGTAEYESLMRVVRSRFEVTLRQFAKKKHK